MLRGFRWQFLVLLSAISLFLVSLAVQSPSAVPATPTPALMFELTDEAVSSTPTPTIEAALVSSLPEVPAVKTYREAVVGHLGRLNPLFANLNPVDRDITALIFEGLVRSNAYGEPEPLLATDWIISSNRLEYVVRLRSDVLWQDGVPFTAADVVYTFSLLRSPDFPGSPALSRFWQTVEVQQLDSHVVRFRLTQPLARFLDALRIGILPEHALRGTMADQIANHPFNLTPIGTGPYQLETLRPDADGRISAVDLRVAPNYRLRPEGQSGYWLDRFSFQLYDRFDDALAALRTGAVDGLQARKPGERAALSGLSQFNLHTALEPTLGVLIFNWQREETRFFREQRVRLALITGLDRSAIVDRHLPNLAVRADSPLFPGTWAYTDALPWPAPDINAARQLLDATNPRGKDSEAEPDPMEPRLGFSILVLDEPALQGLVGDIAAQWSQLGIAVSVEAAPTDRYQQRLDSGDFDSAIVELAMGDSADPDVYAFWDEGQYPDGPNYGGVADRRISEALERARSDPSGINRIVHYHSFQRDFIDRAIAIPLYYPLYTYATAPGVTGVQLGFMGTPASRFYTLRDWDILSG